MPARKKKVSAGSAAGEKGSSGGGSRGDMERLSRELGLSRAAVEAMMAAQGSGLVPQSTSSSSRTRSHMMEKTAKGAASSAKTASAANPWSDFMNEESSPSSSKSKATGSSNTESTEARSAKKLKTNADTANGTNASATAKSTNRDDPTSQDETARTITHKQYHLPLIPPNGSENPMTHKQCVLLQTGTLDAKVPGRRNLSLGGGGDGDHRPCDLWQPTLLFMETIFMKTSVTFVATSCSACHTVALTSDGKAYGWGRNEENQLGLGYNSDAVFIPKLLSSIKGNASALLQGSGDPDSDSYSSDQHKPIAAAAVGKSHTVLVDEDGAVYAAGQNKLGQCGVNSTTEYVVHFKKCVLTDSTGGSSGANLDENAASDKKRGRGRASKGGANDPNSKTSGKGSGSSNGVLISTATDPLCIQIVQVACGESTTMALSREGFLYSTGSAEFGQLGNGDPGEYIVSAGKTAFNDSKAFERRAVFVSVDEENSGSSRMEDRVPLPDSYEIRLSSVACGKHHAVAVEAPFDAPPPVDRNDFRHIRRVFSWGAGNYGCLGHKIQADEYYPRLVDTLTGPLLSSNQPDVASCGTQCSMVVTTQGHVFYWGKHKQVGEATMRPTLLDFLANNGHVVKTCDGSNATVVCSTSNGSTVSWGQGPYGELGYGTSSGPGKKAAHLNKSKDGIVKSSAKPKFVDGLDKCLVLKVSCGYGHACFIVQNEDKEDKDLVEALPRVEVEDVQDLEDAVVQKKGAAVGVGGGASGKKGKKS